MIATIPAYYYQLRRPFEIKKNPGEEQGAPAFLYELGNHLGNVLEVVTDRKLSTSEGYAFDLSVISTGAVCVTPNTWTPESAGTTFTSADFDGDGENDIKVANSSFTYSGMLTIATVPGETYTLTYTVLSQTSSFINSIAYQCPGTLITPNHVTTAPGTYSYSFTPATTLCRIKWLAPVGNYVLSNITIESTDGSDATAGSGGEVISYTADVVSFSDYEPFGMLLPGRHGSAGDYRYGFNGMEADDELKGEGNSYTTEFRQYDPRVGRWLTTDPLASKFPWQSPYVGLDNNPINKVDPSGLATDDWVKDAAGDVKWDKDANSQETTKAGETYLGKTLTYTFNSYIDAKLWDGPTPLLLPSPAGDKLTSTITITGLENDAGELTGISATKDVVLGETPIGTARDYYPGLDDNQNKFGFTGTVHDDNSVLTSTVFNFEQHASVSKLEEIGLRSMGYNIVNVAQKMTLNYSEGKLTLKTYTDVFPSATLTMNGTEIMYYPQPSFTETHSLPIEGYTPPLMKEHIWGGKPIYDYRYKKAMWYQR